MLNVKAKAEKIPLLLVRLKEIGYLCVTYSDKLTSDIDKRQEHVFIPATRQWVIDRIHSRTQKHRLRNRHQRNNGAF